MIQGEVLYSSRSRLAIHSESSWPEQGSGDLLHRHRCRQWHMDLSPDVASEWASYLVVVLVRFVPPSNDERSRR
jgi:hypothetical protein